MLSVDSRNIPPSSTRSKSVDKKYADEDMSRTGEQGAIKIVAFITR